MFPTQLVYVMYWLPKPVAVATAQGPHSHILMTGGGPSDFFGSEILAKSDFLGLWKTPRFFWAAK